MDILKIVIWLLLVSYLVILSIEMLVFSLEYKILMPVDVILHLTTLAGILLIIFYFLID